LKIFAKRLQALEARKPVTTPPDDWRERLARYKRWFEDGEEWAGSQTDEEEANLARSRRYFDDLEAGVAAPKWESKK